jgi:AbrB family looped-hinge helix DNA binding protein
MKLNAKGQLTIPAEIREILDLKPGDDVRFLIEDSAVRLIKFTPSQGHRIAEHFRARGNIALTTDEIMMLTRGD